MCHEMGVTLIAYSPIARGLLSGKYTPQNPPPGLRRRMTSGKRLARMQSLIGLMREIGQANGGKSPAQVALNWVMCKQAVPIPGAKNERQARDNAGALGWRLGEAEVAALDRPLHPAQVPALAGADCRLGKLVWRGHDSILAHISGETSPDNAISGSDQGQPRWRTAARRPRIVP